MDNEDRKYIYFVSDGDAIKIGIAANPTERLSDLQIGTSRPLTLLTFCRGTRKDEARLHRQFDELSLGREWFEKTPALMEFIEHVKVSRELTFAPEREPEPLPPPKERGPWTPEARIALGLDPKPAQPVLAAGYNSNEELDEKYRWRFL